MPADGPVRPDTDDSGMLARGGPNTASRTASASPVTVGYRSSRFLAIALRIAASKSSPAIAASDGASSFSTL